MSNHVVFPPPPPPPPLPPQASPSFANYSQPTHARNNSYRGRGNRGDGGFRGRGRGRGDNYRSSAGGDNRNFEGASGYGGYPSKYGGHSSPPNTGYVSQTESHARSSYPLPDYPPIQQPHYPAYRQDGYAFSSSTYPTTNLDPRPPQQGWLMNGHAPTPNYAAPQHHTLYPFNPQSQNVGNSYYDRQHPLHSQPRPDRNQNQPVVMGPPIRMGFSDERPEVYRQTQAPAKQYPDKHYQERAPASSSHYQNGPYFDSREPRRQDSPSYSRSHHRNSPNAFPNHHSRGNRRGHSDTHGRSRNPNSKSQIAPAVPSFGSPLPGRSITAQESGRKPRKKKRRHNQLGLTPKTEEHESSEEEEDVDEEAKLAAAAGVNGATDEQLQFTYNGRTATLQSSSDIAAWIEERKKRFPTKARAGEIAERKRQLQEAQRASNQARKDLKEQQHKKKPKEANIDPNDAAAKAKLKAEKLRKQLRKEEKRIARAEAQAARIKNEASSASRDKLSLQPSTLDRKRKRTVSSETDVGDWVKIEVVTPAKTDEATSFDDETTEPFKIVTGEESPKGNASRAIKVEASEASNTVPDPLTPTSQPSLPEVEASVLNQQSAGISDIPIEKVPMIALDVSAIPNNEKPDYQSSISMSTSSSDISSSSDDKDATSSSGSSTSGDGPDEAPSTRRGPERVPPPKREKARTICKDFLRNGRCKKGKACRFLHELPKRGSVRSRHSEMVRGGRGNSSRKERVGLYQRLVQQEKDEEDKLKAKASTELGGNGVPEPVQLSTDMAEELHGQA